MPFWPRCFYHLRGNALCLRSPHGSLQKCYLSSLTSIPVQEPQNEPRSLARKPGKKSLNNHADPLIRPDSLQETLDEHRRVNQKRLASRRKHFNPPSPRNLREVKEGSGQGFKRLNLSSRSTQIEDYGGQSRAVSLEWRAATALPRGLRAPWAQDLHQDPSTKHNVPAKQRLMDELLAAEAYLGPTAQEDATAHQALKSVLDTLASVPESRDISYKLIGSRATGLHGPLSDFDLIVQHKHDDDSIDKSSVEVLRRIYKHLRYQVSTKSQSERFITHKIRGGRIPLIDCSHLASGLQVQLQCTDDNYDSIEITKAYLAEFPNLRPIYRIIRQMLAMRGLGSGMHGGISSYPLFHMVVASLKLEAHRVDPGSQLLRFLDFYSTLDFYTTAIEYSHPSSEPAESLTGTGGYDPLSLQPMLVPRKSTKGLQHRMSLQDPADLSNDLGHAAMLIKHVQATFAEALHEIHIAMREWDKMYEHGLDMKTHGKPILAYCLEGNYSWFEEQRRKLSLQAVP